MHKYNILTVYNLPKLSESSCFLPWFWLPSSFYSMSQFQCAFGVGSWCLPFQWRFLCHIEDIMLFHQWLEPIVVHCELLTCWTLNSLSQGWGAQNPNLSWLLVSWRVVNFQFFSFLSLLSVLHSSLFLSSSLDTIPEHSILFHHILFPSSSTYARSFIPQCLQGLFDPPWEIVHK